MYKHLNLKNGGHIIKSDRWYFWRDKLRRSTEWKVESMAHIL